MLDSLSLKPAAAAILPILLLVCCCCCSVVRSVRILQLTDIHLDPHYQSSSSLFHFCHRPAQDDFDWERAGEYGSHGCDTPPWMVERTIKQIAANHGTFDLIVVSGDCGRHDLDDLIRVSKEEILWANRWMKQTLSRYFPSTPTVFSIGNHDVFPAGSIDGLSAGLSGLAEAWEIEEKSFKDGGYWAVDVDVNGKASALTVISLNTLAFSRGNQFARDCQHPRSLGAVHLEWLRKQLQRVEEKKRNALVVGHVPALPDFYHPTCLQEYNRLLYRHRHGVVAQLFGHVHQDFFFVSRHKGIPSVPSLIAPALAPVFNPAYRILQFTSSSSDGDGDDAQPLPHHWEQYYAPAWNCSSSAAFPNFRLEYNSSRALQMSTVSVESLLAVLKEDAQCSSSSTTRRLMLERFRRVSY